MGNVKWEMLDGKREMGKGESNVYALNLIPRIYLLTFSVSRFTFHISHFPSPISYPPFHFLCKDTKNLDKIWHSHKLNVLLHQNKKQKQLWQHQSLA